MSKYQLNKKAAALYAFAVAGMAGTGAVGHEAYEDFRQAASDSAIIRADIKRLMPLTSTILEAPRGKYQFLPPGFAYGYYVHSAHVALEKPSNDVEENCHALRSLRILIDIADNELPNQTHRDAINNHGPTNTLCRLTPKLRQSP